MPVLAVEAAGSDARSLDPLNVPSTTTPVSTEKKLSPSDSSYVLGPGDQVSVLETELDELGGKSFRIDVSGMLTLPLIGRVQASGLTVEQLQAQISKQVGRYVNQPNVVVTITEYRSRPISILGSVASPGVHQIEGQKTLYEVLAMAGGLRPDAGNTVLITRDLRWGAIPLPNAKTDPSGRFSVASIAVKSIINASDPSQNIRICPNDVISVASSELVYAAGSVNRPGGFPIGQSETLSVLQVVSLAQGLQRAAAANKARILRTVANSSERTQIVVNLKQLMSGKGSDVHLQPGDILFVPDSGAKNFSTRSLEAIVTVATGMAVYGKF